MNGFRKNDISWAKCFHTIWFYISFVDQQIIRKRGGNFGHLLSCFLQQKLSNLNRIKSLLILVSSSLYVVVKIFFWDGPYAAYNIECLPAMTGSWTKNWKRIYKAILLIWFYAAWNFKYNIIVSQWKENSQQTLLFKQRAEKINFMS